MATTKLTLDSNFHLRLRSAPNAGFYTFGIDRQLVLNHESSNFMYSRFVTDWRTIDPKKYPWVCDPYKLNGKLVHIEVKSMCLGTCNADFARTS